MTSILKSEMSKGLGKLLNDKTIKVPFYQRSYAWKREQVRELYDDLRRSIDDEVDYYFLGSIVGVPVENNEDVIEIVDGQQRLATTAILLAAIRNKLIELGDDAAANKFEEVFLFHAKGFRNPIRKPTVSLNEIDDDFFQRRVMAPEDNPVIRAPSHRLIDDAAKQAAKLVSEIVGSRSPDDQKGVLDKWVAFIEAGAKVIFIMVDDPADAFMIFETMNDRGLDLSVADLTKNYLFMRAGAQNIDGAKVNWARMASILSYSSDADITKTYIYHLWSSLNGMTYGKELFRDLRQKYNTSAKALGFTKTLSESVDLYAALGNSDAEYWNTYGRHARRALSVLNSSLKVTQVRMLLMAVVETFTPDEAVVIFDCCIRWTVRLIIVGISPSKWEFMYATNAKMIRDKKITNASQLIDSMESDIPNDDVFRSAFADADVTSKAFSRYCLNCLELLNEPDPHLGMDDPTNANREHILPDRADKSLWPHISDEEHEQLKDKLGNHALMTPEQNLARKNGSFADAQKMYKSSAFIWTAKLAQCKGNWDGEAIRKRQAQMADAALKIWPLRPPKRKKSKQ